MKIPNSIYLCHHTKIFRNTPIWYFFPDRRNRIARGGITWSASSNRSLGETRSFSGEQEQGVVFFFRFYFFLFIFYYCLFFLSKWLPLSLSLWRKRVINAHNLTCMCKTLTSICYVCFLIRLETIHAHFFPPLFLYRSHNFGFKCTKLVSHFQHHVKIDNGKNDYFKIHVIGQKLRIGL